MSRAGLSRRSFMALMAGTALASGAGRLSAGDDMATETAISTASSAGVPIRYAAAGSGPPLVLLHGFTDSLETWSELGYIEPLMAAGYRLVLVDQRGHGGSGKPHDAAAYSGRQRADDAAAVLDALGIERAHVLGYSMGGWAALNVARYNPARVDRLIVGGCHPFGQNMAFYRGAVANGIGKWLAAIEHQGGPIASAWKARIEANDLDALRACVADDREDISAELAGFPRPVLFYAGGEDPIRGPAKRAAGTLPRARFAEIPGCNHVTALLRADLVVPVVRTFLADGA